MYKRLTIEDTVRIPPEHLDGNIESGVKSGLKQNVEGTINENSGVIVAVEKVNNVTDGTIEPEDSGVHYTVEYQAIVYEPELHEVVRGEVVDITSFGAFVRIGPFDGLCHVSQVMDEYVDFDEENSMLNSDESNYSLEIGDVVVSRTIAVSLQKDDTNKINLTMRQKGLGKNNWIADYEEERMEAEKEEEQQ